MLMLKNHEIVFFVEFLRFSVLSISEKNNSFFYSILSTNFSFLNYNEIERKTA